MRNISWCPCLNTRLNPNPRINNADRAIVKCKEVWAFTKECHTYFYHSSVHCQGINIPIAISNTIFWQNRGDPVKKDKKYLSTENPGTHDDESAGGVCGVMVWCMHGRWDSAARLANYGSPPRAPQYGLNTNVGTCSCRAVCSARGYSSIFMPKTLRYTLLLQRKYES